MQDMMSGMGWMMGGGVVVWLLDLVVPVLGVAALIKYLRGWQLSEPAPGVSG